MSSQTSSKTNMNTILSVLVLLFVTCVDVKCEKQQQAGPALFNLRDPVTDLRRLSSLPKRSTSGQQLSESQKLDGKNLDEVASTAQDQLLAELVGGKTVAPIYDGAEQANLLAVRLLPAGKRRFDDGPLVGGEWPTAAAAAEEPRLTTDEVLQTAASRARQGAGGRLRIGQKATDLNAIRAARLTALADQRSRQAARATAASLNGDETQVQAGSRERRRQTGRARRQPSQIDEQLSRQESAARRRHKKAGRAPLPRDPNEYDELNGDGRDEDESADEDGDEDEVENSKRSQKKRRRSDSASGDDEELDFDGEKSSSGPAARLDEDASADDEPARDAASERRRRAKSSSRRSQAAEPKKLVGDLAQLDENDDDASGESTNARRFKMLPTELVAAAEAEVAALPARTRVAKIYVEGGSGDVAAAADSAGAASLSEAGYVKQSGADLSTAAGHAHGKQHSHYYQYVEVPKKKAWKFGFKRGNHKHEIMRKEKGHKHKFHSAFKWHAKEKCKKKSKCKSVGKMTWEYKHHKKHHR